MKLTTNYKIGIGAGIAIACGLGYYFLVYKKKDLGVLAQPQDQPKEDQQGGGGGGGGVMANGGDLSTQGNTASNVVEQPAPYDKAPDITATHMNVVNPLTANTRTPNWSALAANIAAQSGATQTTPATTVQVVSGLAPTFASSVSSSQSVGGAKKLAGKTKITFNAMNKPMVAPRII